METALFLHNILNSRWGLSLKSLLVLFCCGFLTYFVSPEIDGNLAFLSPFTLKCLNFSWICVLCNAAFNKAFQILDYQLCVHNSLYKLSYRYTGKKASSKELYSRTDSLVLQYTDSQLRFIFPNNTSQTAKLPSIRNHRLERDLHQEDLFIVARVLLKTTDGVSSGLECTNKIEVSIRHGLFELFEPKQSAHEVFKFYKVGDMITCQIPEQEYSTKIKPPKITTKKKVGCHLISQRHYKLTRNYQGQLFLLKKNVQKIRPSNMKASFDEGISLSDCGVGQYKQSVFLKQKGYKVRQFIFSSKQEIFMRTLSPYVEDMTPLLFNKKTTPKEFLERAEALIRLFNKLSEFKIVHRDIYPGNILWKDSKTPILIDFSHTQYLTPGYTRQTLKETKDISYCDISIYGKNLLSPHYKGERIAREGFAHSSLASDSISSGRDYLYNSQTESYAMRKTLIAYYMRSLYKKQRCLPLEDSLGLVLFSQKGVYCDLEFSLEQLSQGIGYLHSLYTMEHCYQITYSYAVNLEQGKTKIERCAFVNLTPDTLEVHSLSIPCQQHARIKCDKADFIDKWLNKSDFFTIAQALFTYHQNNLHEYIERKKINISYNTIKYALRPHKKEVVYKAKFYLFDNFVTCHLGRASSEVFAEHKRLMLFESCHVNQTTSYKMVEDDKHEMYLVKKVDDRVVKYQRNTDDYQAVKAKHLKYLECSGDHFSIVATGQESSFTRQLSKLSPY